MTLIYIDRHAVRKNTFLFFYIGGKYADITFQTLASGWHSIIYNLLNSNVFSIMENIFLTQLSIEETREKRLLAPGEVLS